MQEKVRLYGSSVVEAAEKIRERLVRTGKMGDSDGSMSWIQIDVSGRDLVVPKAAR